MALETGEYFLSSELRGHEDDVRGICICGDAGIATSSRDRTVKFWMPDPERKHRYVLFKTLVGHSSFVGPLAWIPPRDRLPEGGLVSGGMDTLVLLWDLSKGEISETMRGHQYQVTGLVVDDNGDIISSSMDCTIRRWRKGQVIELWEAHKVAVQAVLKLPSGEIVSGSSDSTLKLWRGRTCLHTFVGHTDTVRGLAAMPGIGVLSSSHDCSIRLWALTGQVMMEMMGHTSLVYSVAAHPSGLIASGSEDCFLKIWRDGICIQSIEHPGCVWDVKFLENGDIVTACSDGAVRIWTAHKDRISDPHESESYTIELSQYKTNRKKVGGLKLTDLPGLEALQVPGTTNGQTIVVREGDNGVAYSWNSTELKWDKIGEVVDGPGDTMNGQVLDGTRYDYVFDVDIGDGEPIRKLPYNRTDNPYAAADKWLLKENLPLSYRQQIVEFILQNTGQKNFSLDTSFRDPYTGSSAYIPGEPSSSGIAPKPIFKHIPKLLLNQRQELPAEDLPQRTRVESPALRADDQVEGHVYHGSPSSLPLWTHGWISRRTGRDHGVIKSQPMDVLGQDGDLPRVMRSSPMVSLTHLMSHGSDYNKSSTTHLGSITEIEIEIAIAIGESAGIRSSKISQVIRRGSFRLDIPGRTIFWRLSTSRR